MHGGTAVAEAPFRSEQRFTGQANKGFGHVEHALAGKQVVIDIPGFGLPAAVSGVIVINFVTEIQPAAAEVVVKQPEAHVVAAGDGKRNMFVQRVSADRVVTHCVEVAHFITLAATL